MDKVISLFENHGPLTGKDLIQKTGMEVFRAWKICTTLDQVTTHIVGKRYLRLDKKVSGYARLSPSIMREFLNYTISGLKADKAEVAVRAEKLEKDIAAISKKKINLARDMIHRLVEGHPDRGDLITRVTFIIAGDVVFDMAHSEPRPEISTGELVNGSDLDIIVVTDNLPDRLVKSLDEAIFKEKYSLLTNPASKEEVDYIIKDLKIVKDQFQFRDFKAMVASKILHEGQYLYGSLDLYDQVKQLLRSYGLVEKLGLLEEEARLNRIMAERTLMSAPEAVDQEGLMALFYTTEEKEEIF